MKNEKLLNAIGKIDDELILAAVEVPAKKEKKKRSVWIKWGALAACLCLFLVTPVAAAAKDLMVEILSDRIGWSVKTKERISVEDFSKEVQELVKEMETESKFLAMESVDEAEEFLGVPIPDNAVLAGAMKDELHVETDVSGQKERYDVHCLVYLRKDKEGELIVVDTEAAYRYWGAPVRVNYRMITDSNSYDSGFGVLYSDEFDREQNPEAKTHVTPSGRECTVFYSGEEHGLFTGYGYVLVDDVLIQVSIIDKAGENVQSCMMDILDAFE